MQAMILAAGLGTRLLPYSAKRPKPLFPILNKPLLLLTIERLQNAGFDKIIVNCHHLKEQIVSAIKGIDGVIVQEEEIILGTGGGLRLALEHMENEPLLISNGDIYHNLDYARLYDAHVNGAGDTRVTMALHDNARFNSIAIKGDRVLGFGDSSADALAFSGLHVIEPAILQDIALGEFSCIISRYKELLARDEIIGVHRMDDCYWTDMGTPSDYLDLHQGLLTRKLPILPELEITTKDLPFCIDSDIEAIIRDWSCVGANVNMAQGCHLQNCVVWDGATVEKGDYINSILI